MNIRETLEKHAWSYDEMGRLALIGKEDFDRAEIELAELKAKNMAMQAVCEKAEEVDYNNLIMHLGGFGNLVKSGYEAEFWKRIIGELQALQQALQELRKEKT